MKALSTRITITEEDLNNAMKQAFIEQVMDKYLYDQIREFMYTKNIEAVVKKLVTDRMSEYFDRYNWDKMIELAEQSAERQIIQRVTKSLNELKKQ